MTALAFAAKHTPKALRIPQKRARLSEGSVAFPKGGDIPGGTPLALCALALHFMDARSKIRLYLSCNPPHCYQ